MKKLNIDNPFFEMMVKLGDLIIINLLFLFCYLLVVTIGAAIAAMYGVFQRMEEEREGNVARTYLRCFREKLKFCTPVWLGMLLVGTVLVFDVIFLGHVGMRGIWKIVGAGTGCLIFLWELVFAWIFPLMGKEELLGAKAVKTAFKMGILRLPATLVMVVLNNILIICLMMDVYYVMLMAPFYLAVGFGMVAYVNHRLIRWKEFYI